MKIYFLLVQNSWKTEIILFQSLNHEEGNLKVQHQSRAAIILYLIPLLSYFQDWILSSNEYCDSSVTNFLQRRRCLLAPCSHLWTPFARLLQRQSCWCSGNTIITSRVGIFFKLYHQGGVKSKVSGVFEDLEFKISEGYEQN